MTGRGDAPNRFSDDPNLWLALRQTWDIPVTDGGLMRFRFLAVAVVAAVLATGGPGVPAGAESGDLGCRSSMAALSDLRGNLAFPPYFSSADAAKQGGEFDPNRYFEAFPALTMRAGYTLDWFYHQDGMGGYPVLYARPLSQPPYINESAYRAAGDQPDYLRFVAPRDNPQGYFDYAAFAMTANQFYLDWHANYNDWRILCDSRDVEEVIGSLQTGSPPGRPMTSQQQQAARAIQNPEPSVTLEDETATVSTLVFTKWGGFYRRTVTIARADHRIIDEQDQPLVEYDCGIVF